jgi:hypothetical protein
LEELIIYVPLIRRAGIEKDDSNNLPLPQERCTEPLPSNERKAQLYLSFANNYRRVTNIDQPNNGEDFCCIPKQKNSTKETINSIIEEEIE